MNYQPAVLSRSSRSIKSVFTLALAPAVSRGLVITSHLERRTFSPANQQSLFLFVFRRPRPSCGITRVRDHAGQNGQGRRKTKEKISKAASGYKHATPKGFRRPSP